MKDGFPKDDAWKQCGVRGIVDDGNKLWLHCYGCHRHRYADAREWVEKNDVDLDTPLLLISRRVRCTRCDRLTVTVTAAPYSNLPRNTAAPRADSTATCPVCRSSDVGNRLRCDGHFFHRPAQHVAFCPTPSWSSVSAMPAATGGPSHAISLSVLFPAPPQTASRL